MDHLRLKTSALAALLCASLPITSLSAAPLAASGPLLRCLVAYAGTTHTIDTTPVSDPYTVASVDIGGRFLFKPVMVGTAHRIDYIKLYAYLDASRQPVLIQVAKYLPPFKTGSRPYLLTGEQYLYAGPVERELTYQCTLQGVK